MIRHLQDLATAAGALRSGGVLILPTDTLPGLHVRADRPDALDRIADLKGRAPDKPLLVLAASLDQARPLLADLDGRRADFCRRCWPGPFSLILPAEPGLPAQVTGRVGSADGSAGTTTIAVRVPAPRFLRDLLTAVGAPLASTSVNVAGQPPATDLAAAVALFAAGVDGWWAPARSDEPDAGAGAGRPSALVDVVTWPPRLLRPGPLPLPS